MCSIGVIALLVGVCSGTSEEQQSLHKGDTLKPEYEAVTSLFLRDASSTGNGDDTNVAFTFFLGFLICFFVASQMWGTLDGEQGVAYFGTASVLCLLVASELWAYPDGNWLLIVSLLWVVAFGCSVYLYIRSRAYTATAKNTQTKSLLLE
jgi:hypothetical protein